MEKKKLTELNQIKLTKKNNKNKTSLDGIVNTVVLGWEDQSSMDGEYLNLSVAAFSCCITLFVFVFYSLKSLINNLVTFTYYKYPSPTILDLFQTPFHKQQQRKTYSRTIQHILNKSLQYRCLRKLQATC